MKYPSGRLGYAIAISVVVSITYHYYIDEIRHPFIIGALILDLVAFFLLAQYIISFILLVRKLVMIINNKINNGNKIKFNI